MSPFRIAIVLLLLTAGSLAAGDLSPWWEPAREIDAKLLAGKWSKGAAATKKLADRILKTAWNDRELGQVLTELAVFRAVAEANLGNRDDAVCYWHAALNLDPGYARSKDLGPYGAAERIFNEAPLRTQGRVPSSWKQRVLFGPYRESFEPVGEPALLRRAMLLNDGAWRRRDMGVFEAEVLIDEEGRVHQPVVTTAGHRNPLVTYAVLDDFCRLRFEPAREDGKPVAVIYRLTVNFRKLRW